MQNVVNDWVSQPRFNVTLLGLFSCIAMLLSAAGIYGVTSYAVAQRTREIGIRAALGAQAGELIKLVIGQGMVPVIGGILIGWVGSFATTRLMKSLLFG